MRERADGDLVDAGLGDRADGVEGDAAGGLEPGAPADERDRLAQLGEGHVVEEDRVDTGLERLADLVERLALDLDRQVGVAARTSSTAAAIEPAARRWLSLISTASSRPKRWLRPPPAATACFSSARRPGVVLRVSRTAAPVPSTAST